MHTKEKMDVHGRQWCFVPSDGIIFFERTRKEDHSTVKQNPGYSDRQPHCGPRHARKIYIMELGAYLWVYTVADAPSVLWLGRPFDKLSYFDSWLSGDPPPPLPPSLPPRLSKGKRAIEWDAPSLLLFLAQSFLWLTKIQWMVRLFVW